VGARFITDRTPIAYLPVIGWPINIIRFAWREPDLADGDDAERPRRYQRRVMMFTPLIFLFICYNVCRALALDITQPKTFQHRAILLQSNVQPAVDRWKSAWPPGKTKMYDAVRITLHILGYLGFVAEIEESQNEAGNLVLQIYTEESRRLIGRGWRKRSKRCIFCSPPLADEGKDAPKVVVDCEMYRSMREDRIVQRVRELAERVRATGPITSARTDELLRARIVHNAFKGRSRHRNLESVRFRANQANHVTETADEERNRPSNASSEREQQQRKISALVPEEKEQPKNRQSHEPLSS